MVIWAATILNWLLYLHNHFLSYSHTVILLFTTQTIRGISHEYLLDFHNWTFTYIIYSICPKPYDSYRMSHMVYHIKYEWYRGVGKCFLQKAVYSCLRGFNLNPRSLEASQWALASLIFSLGRKSTAKVLLSDWPRKRMKSDTVTPLRCKYSMRIANMSVYFGISVMKILKHKTFVFYK